MTAKGGSARLAGYNKPMDSLAEPRSLLAAAVSDLASREGVTVWGFIWNHKSGELELFGSRQFTDEQLVENTTSAVEAICPQYFAKYTGEANA